MDPLKRMQLFEALDQANLVFHVLPGQLTAQDKSTLNESGILDREIGAVPTGPSATDIESSVTAEVAAARRSRAAAGSPLHTQMHVYTRRCMCTHAHKFRIHVPAIKNNHTGPNAFFMLLC